MWDNWTFCLFRTYVWVARANKRSTGHILLKNWILLLSTVHRIWSVLSVIYFVYFLYNNNDLFWVLLIMNLILINIISAEQIFVFASWWFPSKYLLITWRLASKVQTIIPNFSQRRTLSSSMMNKNANRSGQTEEWFWIATKFGAGVQKGTNRLATIKHDGRSNTAMNFYYNTNEE